MTQSHRSKVAPGSGVNKEKQPEKQKPASNQEDGKAYDAKVNSDGSPIWTEEPTLADQFIVLPQTCKQESPRCSVFEIPRDLEEYNKLLGGTVPLEAPRSLIYLEEKEFYEGKWLILVKHAKVLYKKLIRPSDKNIE